MPDEPRPAGPQVGPGPWTVHLTFDVLHKGSGTPVVIYRNPRVALRTPASLPQPFEPVAITRKRVPGPVLKTFPLRDILPASEIARLQFGVSVDGTPVGPNDFAATGPLKLELNVDHEGYLAELHTDVELGANRDAVIRVMLNARPDGPSRVAGQRVFVGDTASAGYKTFRAGIAEFVAMMPPNSHGEANPADTTRCRAVRQHLQQPRARRLRDQGEVPAHRRLLHEEHGRRRGARRARARLDGSLRLVAVPRRLPRHAARSLRREDGQPQDRGHDAGADRRAAGGRCRPHVQEAEGALRHAPCRR